MLAHADLQAFAAQLIQDLLEVPNLQELENQIQKNRLGFASDFLHLHLQGSAFLGDAARNFAPYADLQIEGKEPRSKASFAKRLKCGDMRSQ